MTLTRPVRRAAALAALSLAVAATGASAQQAQTARVRGTIESADATQVVIKTRDGAVVPVRLKQPVVVGLRLKGTATDIVRNAYVGVTSVPGTGETLKAVEIFVFPEAMRGTAEGHRPWDFSPDSTMTNATLAETVLGASGQTMRLTYKGGEKTVQITPETRILTFANGSAEDVKPGAVVTTTVQQLPDGGAQTSRLTIEKP